MRVLILPSWYFKKDSAEIAGRMFHQHAQSLKKAGLEVAIFYAELNPRQAVKRVATFNNEGDIPTWRVHQFALPKINRVFASAWRDKYASLVIELIRGKFKPDIIHAQSYLAGSVASAIKKKTGIPFIVTERLSDFLVDHIPSRYKGMIRKTFRNADRITCVSPGMKGHLMRYTLKDIDVIPNYVDTSIFNCGEDIKKFEKFTWISIGEPSHVKGLDLLLHAFGKLRATIPSFKMQLILIDNIKEKKELMKIVDQYHMANDVQWTGLISQPEIADILQKSHALISGSRIESFGKVIIEALACGLPVVATKTHGASFIIKSADHGILTEVNDADSLMEGMHELLKNYDRFEAAAISKATNNRFSEEVVIEMWKKLYAEVLA